jgi:hypothetical protein
MRNLFFIIAAAVLLHGSGVEAKSRPERSFSFELADSRAAVYRDIGRDLLLRVVRVDMGWSVQVSRRPAGRHSSWNLLFHGLRWHGPHPSDVYAWHVTGSYFSNERALAVRGYPYEVRIILTNPVVEGEGVQARFKAGRVQISWRRTR